MKNNLESWKTSIAGIVIISNVVLMYMGTIDAKDFIAILGAITAGGFIFSKDADKK